MKRLHEMLTEEQITKVWAPLEQACCLPNKAFTSPEFFQLEVDNLYCKTWMSIGFAADVRDIGDAYPVTILGNIPVVMVRDEKGTLRGVLFYRFSWWWSYLVSTVVCQWEFYQTGTVPSKKCEKYCTLSVKRITYSLILSYPRYWSRASNTELINGKQRRYPEY